MANIGQDYQTSQECSDRSLQLTLATGLLKQIVRINQRLDLQHIVSQTVVTGQAPNYLQAFAWVDDYIQQYANDIIQTINSIQRIEQNDQGNALENKITQIAQALGIQVHLFDASQGNTINKYLPNNVMTDSIVVTIAKQSNSYLLLIHTNINQFDRTGDVNQITPSYPFIAQANQSMAPIVGLSPIPQGQLPQSLLALLGELPKYIKVCDLDEFQKKNEVIEICNQVQTEMPQLHDKMEALKMKILQCRKKKGPDDSEDSDEEEESSSYQFEPIKFDEPPDYTCEKCNTKKTQFKDWGMLFMTCYICNRCLLHNYCIEQSKKCPCGKEYCQRQYQRDEMDVFHHFAALDNEFKDRLPANRYLD